MTSLLEHLYEALASEYGVVVETNNVKLTVHKLSVLRTQHSDLACISVCTSRTNPTGEVWLVKKPEARDGED